MGFSRQECWSGLPFPSPGDLPDPGIEPRSPALEADALTSEPPGKPITQIKIQFNSVQLLSCVWLCNPMDCSTPGFPVHHQLPELTQTHVYRVGDVIQPSHSLSSPSPPILTASRSFQMSSSDSHVLNFWGNSMLFSVLVEPVFILINHVQGTLFFTSLPALMVFCVLDEAILIGVKW